MNHHKTAPNQTAHEFPRILHRTETTLVLTVFTLIESDIAFRWVLERSVCCSYSLVLVKRYCWISCSISVSAPLGTVYINQFGKPSLTDGSLESPIHTHRLQLAKKNFAFAFAPYKFTFRVSSHSPMAIKQAAKRPAPVLHNSRVRKNVASDVIPLQVTRPTTLISIIINVANPVISLKEPPKNFNLGLKCEMHVQLYWL